MIGVAATPCPTASASESNASVVALLFCTVKKKVASGAVNCTLYVWFGFKSYVPSNRYAPLPSVVSVIAVTLPSIIRVTRTPLIPVSPPSCIPFALVSNQT